MSTVELKAVGPIDSILFDLPDGQGGVKVFRGTSGVGKTTALRALGGLIGDKDCLTGLAPSDGSERGEVKGLGRSLKISQRVSCAGASSVPHLAGRLDIATLVDPRIIDPLARTKARVRCLVSLGGKKVSPVQLLGDSYAQFAERIDIDAIGDSEDPVAMADKLKRALEREALEVERESDHTAGMATAKRQEAGDVDTLNHATDYSDAVRIHRQALLAVNAAKTRRDNYRQAVSHNQQIQSQIDSISANEADPEVLEADLASQSKIVEGLKERLHSAQIALAQKQSRLDEAKRQASKLSQLNTLLTSPGEDVSDVQIQALESQEQRALESLNQANTLQIRKAALEQSIEYQNRSAELADDAANIRAAAAMVQSEVQKALPVGPIQVEDGTLVVDYELRGKKVPFEELSTGQKWKVAMEYAISAVGKGGVIPLSQEAWQALGPELKDQIAQQCRQCEVWLITGEVCQGELRVEEYLG